jgi:hypothetical protein
MTDARIEKVTVESANSYAKLLIVSDSPAQRDTLLAAWLADAEAQEFAAIGDDADDPAGFVYRATMAADIEPDDIEDECGLIEDGRNLTFRDILASGPGVTMLDSGLNG